MTTDPSSIDPYNNPHETHSMDDILYILNNQKHTLDELLFSYPPSTDQTDNNNTIDPSEDPFIRDLCNEPNPQNSQATPLGAMDNNQTNMYSIPLSVWPSDPVPYSCSCCQSLRQIVHANGFGVTKLDIHGTLGMICHAILTIQPGPQYQMFDFSKKSIEDVKQFLTQYCIDRSQSGFTLIKDPLTIFYEALCVGLGSDENMYESDFMSPSSSNSREFQMDQAENSNNRERPARPSLVVQRERSRNLTLKQLEQYFHLPIHEAAKRLELSATVVKNTCRRFGIKRWPHRKVHSMEKQISYWESKLLRSKDSAERARAENQIESLRGEIAKFGEGSNNLSDDDDDDDDD